MHTVNKFNFTNYEIRNSSVSKFAANSDLVRKMEFVYSSHIEFAANSNLVRFPNFIFFEIEFVYSSHMEFTANSNLVLFPNYKNVLNSSVSEFAAKSQRIRISSFSELQKNKSFNDAYAPIYAAMEDAPWWVKCHMTSYPAGLPRSS